MTTESRPYDCSKNPPEWISWRIIDPKWPNHYIRVPKGPGKKTCDQMIRSIVELGILEHGKFEEIETGGKSALVFRLNIPGSGKELVSKTKLKWGRRALSTRAITGVGAAGLVGAVIAGAGFHSYMSDKSTYSLNDKLSEYWKLYDNRYEKAVTDDQSRLYLSEMNDGWINLNNDLSKVEEHVNNMDEIDDAERQPKIDAMFFTVY